MTSPQRRKELELTRAADRRLSSMGSHADDGGDQGICLKVLIIVGGTERKSA